MKPMKPKVLRGFGGRGARGFGPVVFGDAVYGGAADFCTVKLDAHSLKELWWVDSGEFRVGTAIGDTYLVVVGRENVGVRSAADGKLLWIRHTYPAAFAWRESVVVVDIPRVTFHDPATGDVTRAIEAPAGFWPGIGRFGDSLILQNDGVDCAALNLSSGELQWRRPLVEEMRAQVPYATDTRSITAVSGSGDVVIACSQGATFAIRLDDGGIRWAAPRVSSANIPPIVHDGRVFVVSGGRFRALDEQTGAVLYQADASENNAIEERPGTLYKGRLAVAHTTTGLLLIFDTATGALVNRYQAKSTLWWTAEANGRLLCRTGDGTMLVFNESIWEPRSP